MKYLIVINSTGKITKRYKPIYNTDIDISAILKRAVIQRLECLSDKQNVGGSTPPGTTKVNRMNKPTIKDLVTSKPLPCPICERPNMRPSDHHMVPRSRGGKATETICCDCHRAIHATFTNKELEEKYHTVDILLTHEDFAKMIKFISKQDPGGRVTTKKNKDRLRRE